MRRIGRVSGFAILAMLLGSTGAAGQTVGPDEAVKPNGAVEQKIGLSPAQKKAIYNVVLGQRVKPPTLPLVAAVGASVPPSAPLSDLPEAVTPGDPSAALLKYAMVDDNIVVVDPITMRVVEVIRDKP